MAEAFICDAVRTPVGGALSAVRADDLAESMTRAPFVMPKAESAFSRANAVYDTTIGWRFVNPKMKKDFGVDSMPETADNVAADFGVSPRRPGRLRRPQPGPLGRGAGGRPVRATRSCRSRSRRRRATRSSSSVDEHPRPGTTVETLAKLRGVNGPDLTVTAGNASGVNDGAAALVIASEAAAKAQGLTPKARVVAMAAAGVEPRIMGIGPAPAARRVLERAGLYASTRWT